MKELPREERGRRAERCREGGEWSAEALKWRREGDGRVGGRGLSPLGVKSLKRDWVLAKSYEIHYNNNKSKRCLITMRY